MTLVYTTDNWKAANTTLVASYNSTSHVATAHIPPQYNGGHVEYYIVAFDGNSNKAINPSNGTYFSYTVTTPSGTATNTWIELWHRDKHMDRTRTCRCYLRRWRNNSVLLTSPEDTDRFNLSLTKLSTGLPKQHISNQR